jgi:hypothetical protein
MLPMWPSLAHVKPENAQRLLKSLWLHEKESSRRMNYSILGLVCFLLGLILIARVFILWRYTHNVLPVVLAVILIEGIGIFLIRKAPPS